MENRKLAHIEKIISVDKIEGADKIEKCTVLGWECVVKKGAVVPGEWVVYIEIDSVVPSTNPYFEFMKDRKYRVRTIKLRKQISQGLVVKLSDLPEMMKFHVQGIGYELCDEGEDVTELLGITKYLTPSEREAEFTGLAKKKHTWFTKFMTRFSWYRKLTKKRSKSFPEWISKTDEDRIQNMPFILKKHEADLFYTSEKVDGQSATFWYRKGWFWNEFGICSRTVRKFEIDGSNWSQVAKQFEVKKKLTAYYKKTGKQIAIQGEQIKGSIQGGKYHNGKNNKVESPYDFFVFNVYDINAKHYFALDEMLDFCKDVGLKTVPILDMAFKLKPTVPEMVQYAQGKSVLADIEREGVVIRSHDQKVSFKVISPEFLLKDTE